MVHHLFLFLKMGSGEAFTWAFDDFGPLEHQRQPAHETLALCAFITLVCRKPQMFLLHILVSRVIEIGIVSSKGESSYPKGQRG